MYIALYSDVPKGVQWLAGVATLALCAAIVVAVTAAAQRWWAAGLEPDVFENGRRGVLARQARDAAAGVRAGAADVETV